MKNAFLKRHDKFMREINFINTKHKNYCAPFFTCDSIFINSKGDAIRADQINEETILGTNKGNSHVVKLIKMEYSGPVRRLYNVRLTSEVLVKSVNLNEPFKIDSVNITEEFYHGYVYNVIVKNNAFISIFPKYKNSGHYLATFGCNESQHDYIYSQKIKDDILITCCDFTVIFSNDLFIGDNKEILGINLKRLKRMQSSFLSIPFAFVKTLFISEVKIYPMNSYMI